jgi:P-type Ca2+ transporter type 2C
MAEFFDISGLEGLSEEEAARRQAAEGFNEIPSASKRGILTVALEVIREPMFLLLVAAGAVSLMLGEIEEGLILLSFVVVVMGITIYQQRKSERALEALRDLSSPRANVIRDGQQRRIAGRDVVRGDSLVLAEGDRVPADAVLIFSINLSVDESLLTGESIPVLKSATEDELEMGAPGGDGQPFVFSGTLVVQGSGAGVVRAIGADTEIGKIGKALESIETELTPLQTQTRRLVRNIAVIILALAILVAVLYGVTRHEQHLWQNGVLAGITLAMAMLPEEFPVVLTIFLTMGARRISKKEVLTRSVPAVETLGSATVLCVDKTGTLTYNRISVSRLSADGLQYDLADHKRAPLPEEFHELVEFSILASQKDPFDPIERAMKRLGERKLFETEHLHEDWNLLREYALSQELLALSHVWKSPDGNEYVIAAKGAPEAVADLCHLAEADRSRMMRQVGEMADDGLRVLAVARSQFGEADLPVDQHEFAFDLLGLVGLADPVRPNVAQSIEECYQAGIRVVMITGDYPGTALNVAAQIGLDSPGQYVTGPELDAMGHDELRERVESVNIFARVVPEQKLRLVDSLKANGEVVAMTGDGVNDAPALKSAQIGIAMGGRGTDVAREAAALVLLNDDFSSIKDAVRLGRRIFDNIKKAMAYIVAVHVPIAGLSLAAVVFRLPLILLPIHVAFLELIIDPACSIVFEAEPEEPGVMRRPPRNPSDPLFNRRTLSISLGQGLVALTIISTILATALATQHGSIAARMPEARTLAFTTMVFANLCLILTNRSWSRTVIQTMRVPNRALWWVLGGTVVFLGLVLYVPAFRPVFGFTRLSAQDVLICLGGGVLSVVWFEVYKAVRGRRAGRAI